MVVRASCWRRRDLAGCLAGFAGRGPCPCCRLSGLRRRCLRRGPPLPLP